MRISIGLGVDLVIELRKDRLAMHGQIKSIIAVAPPSYKSCQHRPPIDGSNDRNGIHLATKIQNIRDLQRSCTF